MARPSATPRLRDIDPIAFGENVARQVEEHVVTMLLKLDMAATWSLPHGAILLQSEARMLAMYAQQGLIGDWQDHGCAADAYVSLCQALFTTASAPHDIGDVPEDVTPSDDVGIVLLASKARIRIDRRQRVPVRELACLAGVAPDHVRLLGRQGELEVVDGEVRAAECRRWLSGRGIEGI